MADRKKLRRLEKLEKAWEEAPEVKGVNKRHHLKRIRAAQETYGDFWEAFAVELDKLEYPE